MALATLPRYSTVRKAQVLVIILAVLVEATQSRPRSVTTKGKSLSLLLAKKWNSPKLYSLEICGKLGDPCKFKSRKHCCAVGFTCVRDMKKRHRKHHLSRFGKCHPVPTVSSSDREFQEGYYNVAMREN